MPSTSCLFFCGFHLDLTTETLWHGAQRLPLRPKAWALLRYLVEHPHRLIPQAELLAAIWQREYVSDDLLRGAIRELRRVLQDEAAAPRCIETVSGRGYRFIAAVSRTPPSLPAPEASQLLQPAALLAPEAPPSAPTTAVLAEEYKWVTILCGALAEAPALAVRLGPEGLYRLLQTVVNLAQEVLQHYAGTLMLATSESFTALFGAPVAQEDHARRTVLAALELRQGLQASPALHAQLAGNALALRMGLHSGLVVVGGLGQDPQRLATIVGAPLHVATRIQQRAEPGTILLSAATYQLVHAEVRAAPCGTLDIAGQPTPVPIYTLQGLVRRQAGVVGRGRQDPSPFVGRERELALLHDHLAAARAGQGQVVGLVGEPGMGKTRLLAEFCRKVVGNQVTVYAGQCLSYGQATPYLPVRDILRQMCGLVEGDEPAGHTAAVQYRLHTSGIHVEDDVALLLQLLDLPVAPESLAQRSPETRQTRTFALLRHLILAAAPPPLVLVVENLHWSDPTSAAWLASLVERLAGAAVLLLVTYRPGYQPAWGTHAIVTQVALPPLRAPESRTVVQAVLGTVPLSSGRLQAMVAQAGGNPFFLEELAWHAVEQGGRDTPGALPETVHAVLAARIDRLSPEAKRLLQTAAVIGMEVPLPLVQAIAELPDEELQRGLAHLQAAEFLYETRLFPEPAYTFKHALMQEVAYDSLLLERRRGLHAHIVATLEGDVGDRLIEQVEWLAHHALRGEVWDKALGYCQQAGEKAMTRSAYREAGGYFEQALSAFQHLPEQQDTREQAIDLRVALHHVRLIRGEPAEHLLQELQEAERLVEALDDPDRLGWVAQRLSDHCAVFGPYDRAIAYGQRARTLAAARGNLGLHVSAQISMGLASFNQGDYRQAMHCFRPAIVALEGEQRYEFFGMSRLPAGRAHTFMVYCLAAVGEFAEGMALSAEGLRLAEAVNHPRSLVTAYLGVGCLYIHKGELHQALSLLERALRLCQDVELYWEFPIVAEFLGVAYLLSGRVDEAVRLLERATRMAMRPSLRLTLSEGYLLAGRFEEARTRANSVLERVRLRKERGFEAHALRLLGDIAAQRKPPESAQAEAYYRQALALAEELGMRPLLAHCHRDLGLLYVKIDQPEQAHIALSTAIEMYQSMDMTFWLPETEAALAQVEGR